MRLHSPASTSSRYRSLLPSPPLTGQLMGQAAHSCSNLRVLPPTGAQMGLMRVGPSSSLHLVLLLSSSICRVTELSSYVRRVQLGLLRSSHPRVAVLRSGLRSGRLGSHNR